MLLQPGRMQWPRGLGYAPAGMDRLGPGALYQTADRSGAWCYEDPGGGDIPLRQVWQLVALACDVDGDLCGRAPPTQHVTRQTHVPDPSSLHKLRWMCWDQQLWQFTSRGRSGETGALVFVAVGPRPVQRTSLNCVSTPESDVMGTKRLLRLIDLP